MNTTRAILIITVISAALFFFSDNKADPDLWGHLAFGREISIEKHVPRMDSYSYSSPGAEWIDHEWLSELVFYKVFSRFGGAGLVLLKTSAGILTALLLLMSVSGKTKSVIMRLAFLLLSFSIISFGFLTRPQIFTYLFFTALMVFLDRFRSTGNRAWIYPLPLVFLVWANSHGGFVAGLAALALFYLVISVKKGLDPALSAVCALSLLATLVNPYGVELWGFLFRSLSSPRPYLYEWAGMELSGDYADYLAAALIAVAALVFSRIKRDPFDAALISAALFMSMLQKRHIVLYAVVFCVLTPPYAASLIGKPMKDLEKRISAAALAALLSCLAFFFVCASLFFGKTDPLKIEIPPGKYPVNAVKFMKDNGINGNIFCFFDWSQMCIWELPRSRVFFDGRYRTVYSEDLIRGYFGVLFSERDHKAYLEDHPGTDIMLLHRLNPLVRDIELDLRWVRVYSSPVAVIFVKDDQKNRRVIEDLRENRLINRPVEAPYYLE